MSDQQTIKYRIIGALVIAVCFSLAWWILLDHDIQRTDVQQLYIPEPLEIERFEIAEIDPVKKVVDVEVKEVPKKEEKKVTSAAEKSKKPIAERKSNGLPEAWVVQVASFQSKANAEKLQNKLLKDNYTAYIKKFNVSGKNTFRVLIGPKLSTSIAEEIKNNVTKSYALEARVIQYASGFEQ
jgi:DedD protein